MSNVTALTANLANRKKAMLAGNLLLWLFTGAYVASPVDLIPDVIPVIGWTDDLLGMVVTVAITLYTLAYLRRHGATKALTRSEEPGRGVVIDAPAAATTSTRIPGYEPLSIPEINKL